MTERRMEIVSAGPATTVQDLGRPGLIGAGLSRGGAADRRAFLEGLALLGNAPEAAGLEMAGMGGRFRFTEPVRIALTGAEMRATCDGAPIRHRASTRIETGALLEIGPALHGIYGYLHVAGGIETSPELGGRGFHGIGGLGARLADGTSLPLGKDRSPDAAPQKLPAASAGKGAIRVMPGPQTHLFPEEVQETFMATTFTRSPRGNRQGVRFDHDGAPFSTGGQLTLVSDFIREGDIQMTGDGTPFVLLADCQTMGGYPRIGTVLPADLHRVAQMAAGETVQFRMVTLEEAERSYESDEATLRTLRKSITPLVRDPREMKDLLSYNLITKPVEGD